jgi:hypothetical protein
MSRMKVVAGNNSLDAPFVDKTCERVAGRVFDFAGKDLKKLLDKDR